MTDRAARNELFRLNSVFSCSKSVLSPLCKTTLRPHLQHCVETGSFFFKKGTACYEEERSATPMVGGRVESHSTTNSVTFNLSRCKRDTGVKNSKIVNGLGPEGFFSKMQTRANAAVRGASPPIWWRFLSKKVVDQWKIMPRNLVSIQCDFI